MHLDVCTLCGDSDHAATDCPTYAPPELRQAANRFRRDGACRSCDGFHGPSAPCGIPSGPPAGWRPARRATAPLPKTVHPVT